MKIGIITHHYVKNYGAFLQMKALYEVLQNLYSKADIKVINYVVPKHLGRNIIHILHPRIGIDTPKSYIKKIRQLFLFIRYEHQIPRTKHIRSAREIEALNLDLLVLGSDEIWNLKGWGVSPLKFGVEIENIRTLAYAPSVGSPIIKESIGRSIIQGIKSIDYLSVRDEETLAFLYSVGCDKVVKMPDPIFLYDFTPDISAEEIEALPYPYLLVYDCKLTNAMIHEVVSYAHGRGWKIVGAGENKPYYDESLIALSPYEWVSLFSHAKQVVTGTFHGTVFAIKYEKPLLCYPTEENRICKIKSVLNDLGFTSCLITLGQESTIAFVIRDETGYSHAQLILRQQIAAAKEFLMQV